MMMEVMLMLPKVGMVGMKRREVLMTGGPHTLGYTVEDGRH